MGFDLGSIGGGMTSRGQENYDRTKTLLGSGAKKALHNLYGRAAKDIKRGYNQAEGKIAGIENAERQSILNTQQQQIAEMDQRMTSRGLYNTSIGVGGGTEYQGILANTQQSLNDLSSRLASLYSGLYTSRGSELAGLRQAKFGARQQYTNDLAQFLMGAPGIQEEGVDLYKLAETAAKFVPGGGGGGSAFMGDTGGGGGGGGGTYGPGF